MTRLLVLMLVLAISTPVLADQKADLVARANKEFERGKYEDALKTLEAAYAIDPDPSIVFALGQVHMKLGDCKQAIAYYRSYLATKPDPKQAATVYKAIDRCKMMKMEADTNKPEPVEPVKPVKPEPSEPPPKPEPPKPPAPVTPSSEHVPWYRDVVGDVLIVGGIAGGVVSALMYRSARTHRTNADAALSYVEYSDELATSKRNQKIAIGAAGGAVALVTLGVVRFSLRATSERVDVAVTNTGAVASWRVRF